MSDPYIGEIRMVSFRFAPYGWALCQGQTMQVNQNQALYALIGNIYGGTAPSTFNLPNFSGRSPVGTGSAQGLTPMSLADTGGAETATLSISQMPVHNHQGTASGQGSSIAISIPASTSTENGQQLPGPDRVLGVASYGGHAITDYTTSAPNTTLAPFNAPANISLNTLAIGYTGGNSPVALRNPYLAINFAIALSGIFPTQE